MNGCCVCVEVRNIVESIIEKSAFTCTVHDVSRKPVESIVDSCKLTNRNREKDPLLHLIWHERCCVCVCVCDVWVCLCVHGGERMLQQNRELEIPGCWTALMRRQEGKDRSLTFDFRWHPVRFPQQCFFTLPLLLPWCWLKHSVKTSARFSKLKLVSCKELYFFCLCRSQLRSYHFEELPVAIPCMV